MPLKIQSTTARIAIETQKAKMYIDNKAPLLTHQREDTKLQVRTEKPKVLIDQYECFAAVGFKNPLDLARDEAQRAYQQVLQFIAETAQDGDRLAQIHKGGNPVIDIAVRKSLRQAQIDVGEFPVPQPKFDVVGSVNVDWIPGNLTFDSELHPVSYEVTPHKVNIYLEQKNSIDIEYVGSNLDRRI